MLSIDNFLNLVKQGIKKNDKVIFVSGNDSADLDSIISSLLFAYISHVTRKEDQDDTMYIPIIKVPRADLELRPELKYVLKETGLDYNKLITIDQINTSAATDIVLVDHNQLTGVFDTKEWSKHVVGVLDHHMDEGLYLNAPIRTVSMVGSCVTLVLNHFRVKKDSDWLTDEVRKLAMAPLLIDTVNLKWDLGRTTQLDVDTYHILQDNNNTNQTAYFRAIEKVKFEVDQMSNYDILRRDYKEFIVNNYRIGTSAVTWKFKAWIDREGEHGIDNIMDSVKNYAKERELDLEVIFTSFEDEEKVYRRELAVFIINQNLQPIKQSLENNGHLQLIPSFGNNFYQQGNVKMSRKQVWPLIKQLLESQ